MAKITRKKRDTDKLVIQPEVREGYESKLKMRLQDRHRVDSEDVERKWNEMESTIIGVANEVTGGKKVNRNEDCVKCIAGKNRTRERMIQRQTAINY
jgi:hypothetical protein